MTRVRNVTIEGIEHEGRTYDVEVTPDDRVRWIYCRGHYCGRPDYHGDVRFHVRGGLLETITRLALEAIAKGATA